EPCRVPTNEREQSMANAVSNIRPFKRERVEFKSKTTGEQVVYFQVTALDDEGGLVVIRSGDVDKVKHLETGKTHAFEGEVRGPTQVAGILMRPVGEPQESSTF